jgi:hypothetical protein
MIEPLINQWITVYLNLGWSLIPIKPRSKEPLIPWKEFQTRRADMKEIEGWIARWPEMNIGLVTGCISGLVVADLDGLTGKAFGTQLKLQSSITSLTGKGKQLYYKWTEHADNSASKIAPGVDIRADGGFVVLPPSIHPNGKHYRWERFVPKDLITFPKTLVTVNVEPIKTSLIGKEPGWIAKALEEMKIGNIDDTLVSILGKMRRDGWTQQDALSILRPIAEEKGAESGHVEDKIRNIWSRYEPKASTSGYIQPLYGQSQTTLSIHSPANDDSYSKFQLSVSNQPSRNGLQTGFPTLDKYFEGGIKSERLFTVAARTGTGKTNFAIALAANLCQQGKKVLFFSTEFQYEKIWQRYIATLSDPTEFRAHSFHVCDSFSPRIEQVEEAIKRIMPDVFIFDHINHIGEQIETLSTFMQGCNFIQRKYSCQGIMVAQLNRSADWVEAGKRVEPRMSMIKGSGTIEQASSRVLLLSEMRVTPEMNEIIGVLDKNDSGDRGIIQFGLYKNPYILRELI